MPPKRSSKKKTEEEDDGYDISFESDGEMQDDELDRDPEIMDEDEEDADEEDADEEDEDEKEEDEADTVYNEFQGRVSTLSVINKPNVLEIAKTSFVNDLYDKFDEALIQFDEPNLKTILTLSRKIIDQYYHDLEEEEEEEDEFVINELEREKTQSSVKTYPSLFSQILSSYEKTAIIGFRAQQIANGAEIYVQTYANDVSFAIAERELKESKLPYFLDRRLPDGSYVAVKLENLLDVTPN